MQTFFFLFFVLTHLVLGQGTGIEKTEPDKSVQWGYKVFLKPQVTLEQLRSIRKTIKDKGIAILYPSDRDWKLPTGYLSLSSHWDSVDLEKLSSLIESVQPTEITKRYKLQLIPDVKSQQIKRLLRAFTLNKIQVIYQAPIKTPSYFSVKTALSPNQIKEIEEIGPYIESIEG